MKKAVQQSLSTLLALLVLVSTFSFTVEKHFCGSILVDKAIFSEAVDCGMEMHPEMAATEDSCCKNEKTSVEGQDELKIGFQSLDLDQQFFLTSFTYSYLELFEGSPFQSVPFQNYSPPLLVTDIQVLDQVFLI